MRDINSNTRLDIDDLQAISVLMPKWRDILDHADKNERAQSHLRNGFSRFNVPPSVVELLQALVRHVNRN